MMPNGSGALPAAMTSALAAVAAASTGSGQRRSSRIGRTPRREDQALARVMRVRAVAGPA